MDDVCAAVRAALPSAVGDIEVYAFHGPVRVRGVGVVLELSLYDASKRKWKTGEVVAVGPEDVAAPGRAIARLGKALERLADPEVASSALGSEIADALELDAPEYPDDAFDPTPEDEARRAAASAVITGRFDAVAARMREVFGLRLPRHVGVLAAFLHGLSPTEARAFQSYGYSATGILDWFADGGLDRRPAGGADPRLHWRFRRDPPELVTVLGGGSDGLHFGLWYDDPAELPSFIVENYARDDGATTTVGLTTVLQQLRHRLDDQDRGEPASAIERAFRAALAAAETADEAAVAADGPRRWADCPRYRTVAGVGPALARGPAATIWPSYEHAGDREARYRLRALRVDRWVREARAALAQGSPGPALLLGRELFWTDDERWATEAGELLEGAYTALGRGALAGILRAHLADRDRPNVDIYRE